MCNPYYNCSNCCCNSPAKKKCQCSCRLGECQRLVHLLHHWYDTPEMPKKCTCCEQIKCKKNNLLHKLCPVPGLRGETIKQVLSMPTIPLCVSPPLKSTAVVPKTEACEEAIARKSIPNVERDAAGRLLWELNESTVRPPRKRAGAVQKRQLNTFLKGLKNWYAKQMKGTVRLHTARDTGAEYVDTKPRKQKANRKKKRNSAVRDSYHWTPIFSDFNFAFEDDESPTDSPADSILTIISGTRLTIITTKPDVEVVDETIAMEDITNLLKQIQAKPKRPILFHSPFNRDVVWTWRNYDPLDDLPKTLAEKRRKRNKPRKSEYTPWTMNIVNDLIEGKPVSDKQFKTNTELQSVVNELALEIKQGEMHRVKHSSKL
uniref:Uncharacterized protein n=1 Tax=Bactrocera latifrons TaxID=174628 RepID=A0A0K8W2F3_BACLA